MARRKMTTYVDEELLRSAKVLAARRGGKVYEVFEEALRRYLEEAMVDDAGQRRRIWPKPFRSGEEIVGCPGYRARRP